MQTFFHSLTCCSLATADFDLDLIRFDVACRRQSRPRIFSTKVVFGSQATNCICCTLRAEWEVLLNLPTRHTQKHIVLCWTQHNGTQHCSSGKHCWGALLWKVFTPRPLEEAEDDSQDLSREFPFQGPSKPPGSTAASKFKMPLSSNWWLMISPYIKNVCSMYYYRMSITILGQVQYAETATKHSPSWEVSSTKTRISTNANEVLE